MASYDDLIELEYDERGDVLYSSEGAPRAALSHEITEDILLRYTPPNREVVGITILNFLQHFPLENRKSLLSHAKAIVKDLFQRYRYVPLLIGDEESPMFGDGDPSHGPIEYAGPLPWLQISITTIDDASSDQGTVYPSSFPLIESPSIHWSQAMAKDDTA
jgi:uncharacterized protein YuzE